MRPLFLACSFKARGGGGMQGRWRERLREREGAGREVRGEMGEKWRDSERGREEGGGREVGGEGERAVCCILLQGHASLMTSSNPNCLPEGPLGGRAST